MEKQHKMRFVHDRFKSNQRSKFNNDEQYYQGKLGITRLKGRRENNEYGIKNDLAYVERTIVGKKQSLKKANEFTTR
jgi:hypothetical protein